jgi:RNA polymerase sigma-70 factor, ECF subfamily
MCVSCAPGECLEQIQDDFKEADRVTAGSRDEARMIASILAGETHLFHELIRPYERRVYAMALSFLRNEADAEDVAQEAFLKAFRNLASFRGEAKFGTWLVSITLNEARSRIRRRDAVTMESLDEPQDGQAEASPALLRDWKEIPSEALERKEVRLLLHRAITGLPLIYREVFQLRDIEHLSVNEAAESLGITIASVKVRLHRARLMLQKILAPELKQFTPKRRWWAW